MGASKSKFNLINHTIQYPPDNDKFERSQKQSPISKFSHLGRLYAPNYSKEYLSPTNFKKRSTDVCKGVCELQKSYGTEKFFRRFK